MVLYLGCLRSGRERPQFTPFNRHAAAAAAQQQQQQLLQLLLAWSVLHGHWPRCVAAAAMDFGEEVARHADLLVQTNKLVAAGLLTQEAAAGVQAKIHARLHAIISRHIASGGHNRGEQQVCGTQHENNPAGGNAGTSACDDAPSGAAEVVSGAPGSGGEVAGISTKAHRTQPPKRKRSSPLLRIGKDGHVRPTKVQLKLTEFGMAANKASKAACCQLDKPEEVFVCPVACCERTFGTRAGMLSHCALDPTGIVLLWRSWRPIRTKAPLHFGSAWALAGALWSPLRSP